MKRSLLIFTCSLSVCILTSCGSGDSSAAAPESPQEEKATSEDETPSGVESFVGLSLEEAQILAEKKGLKHRVISVDGEPRPVTADFLPDRVNFEVEKGKVTKVNQG